MAPVQENEAEKYRQVKEEGGKLQLGGRGVGLQGSIVLRAIEVVRVDI